MPKTINSIKLVPAHPERAIICYQSTDADPAHLPMSGELDVIFAHNVNAKDALQSIAPLGQISVSELQAYLNDQRPVCSVTSLLTYDAQLYHGGSVDYLEGVPGEIVSKVFEGRREASSEGAPVYNPATDTIAPLGAGGVITSETIEGIQRTEMLRCILVEVQHIIGDNLVLLGNAEQIGELCQDYLP